MHVFQILEFIYSYFIGFSVIKGANRFYTLKYFLMTIYVTINNSNKYGSNHSKIEFLEYLKKERERATYNEQRTRVHIARTFEKETFRNGQFAFPRVGHLKTLAFEYLIREFGWKFAPLFARARTLFLETVQVPKLWLRWAAKVDCIEDYPRASLTLGSPRCIVKSCFHRATALG